MKNLMILKSKKFYFISLIILVFSTNTKVFAWTSYATKGTSVNKTGQFIFIPSVSYITSGGNLGGLSGADSICATAASSAQLPGTWKAVLSDQTTDANSRITISGNVYNLGGAIIAGNSAEFWTGYWQNPVVFTEKGKEYFGDIRTGTQAGGTKFINRTCISWTSNLSSEYANKNNSRSTRDVFQTGNQYYCLGNTPFYCISNSTTFFLTAANSVPQKYHTIFSTNSATFTGNLGGVSGADASCQSAATIAELDGTFIAFVCSTGRSPQWFADLMRGGIKTTSNKVLSYNRDFFGQNDIASYVLSETGISVTGAVHTGCLSAGGGSVGSTCSNWTSTSGNDSEGSTNTDGYYWKGPFSTGSDTVNGCSANARLFCISTTAQ